MPYIQDDSLGGLGEVKYWRLTQSQAQALYGPGWVLYEGQSIAGSALATLLSISTLEDHRALFPRAGNNGRSDAYANPDGDQIAGTNNQDRFASHIHNAKNVNSAGGNNNQISSQGGDSGSFRTANDVVMATGGSETSGKSIILNAFIRIN